MEKQFTDVGGIRLAYCDSGGEAPAILFVHGNSSSSQAFERQFQGSLVDDFRLVALDLPGHGDSGRVPVTEYGLPFYARRIVGLASLLGISDAVLVGWSLGGHIVLECADSMPAVPGVLIFGTPPLGAPPNIEQAFLPNPDFAVGMTGQLTGEQAAAYARSFLGDTPNAQLAAQFAADILATDPNAREGLALSVGGAFVDEVELVARMKRPLAILHGKQERLANLAYIESLSMPSLWRGEVQLIEDAGHAPHLETPEVFNRLLAEFVRDVI